MINKTYFVGTHIYVLSVVLSSFFILQGTFLISFPFQSLRLDLLVSDEKYSYSNCFCPTGNVSFPSDFFQYFFFVLF